MHREKFTRIEEDSGKNDAQTNTWISLKLLKFHYYLMLSTYKTNITFLAIFLIVFFFSHSSASSFFCMFESSLSVLGNEFTPTYTRWAFRRHKDQNVQVFSLYWFRLAPTIASRLNNFSKEKLAAWLWSVLHTWEWKNTNSYGNEMY